MESAIRIILLISALGSFGYGLIKYSKKKTALFKVLISGAIGCFMLGRLYELITVLISGSIPLVFNIGMLATIGGFSFIFSASYSQMDGLVDDRSKEMGKYRAIALLAPVIIFAIYSLIALSKISVAAKVICFILFAVIAAASYLNLKHVIIPDVSFGIIESIRSYSLTAIITAVLYALQIVSEKLMLSTLWMISSVLIAIAYPCIMITMERGSRKWTL